MGEPDWVWVQLTSQRAVVVHALDEGNLSHSLCGRQVHGKVTPAQPGMMRCRQCLHRIDDDTISPVIGGDRVDSLNEELDKERRRSARLYNALQELIGMHRLHESVVGAAPAEEWCHWTTPLSATDQDDKTRVMDVIDEEGRELSRLGYLE